MRFLDQVVLHVEDGPAVEAVPIQISALKGRILVLTVKAQDTFAFGDSIPASWINMDPRKRAEAVAAWIRKAADYCRQPRIRYESLVKDPTNGASHQKGGEA